MRVAFLYCLALAMISYVQIFAQTAGARISGIVADARKQALSGATIILHSAQDTAFTQTKTGDKNGAFVFTNLPDGNYTLDVSYIGFKPYHSPKLTLDETHRIVLLPVILLQFSTDQRLKEVVINAHKPLIEQKTDRTIINVDAMLSAAGSNALEVLAKSPGVIVNSNDDISLNGKSNVLVLIDDRATYMTAQSLAAYLRSLPAGMLHKLELISNPPAKYEANGNAVINIVLKKNLAGGFNGTVNLGYNQGVYARSNEALNINYRTGRFNIFSSSSYSLDQNFNTQAFNRYYYHSDGSPDKKIFQNSFSRYRSDGWNIRTGMDYFVSAKTTLGVS